jgi:putative ABC transport system permease protein
LYHPIEPTVYFQIPKYYGAYILKVKHGNEQLALAKAQQEWNRFFPDYPFDYQYLNDVYLDSYKKDLVQGKLINILALCSIIISCIGLIGISGILLVQKTKEIGVHKVNGARSIQVIARLNMNYIKWIIIAFILATPLAYYFMTNWLDNFAYKINLGWWTFSLGGILVLIVAISTVTWQSWNAANKNPVEALRYE